MATSKPSAAKPCTVARERAAGKGVPAGILSGSGVGGVDDGRGRTTISPEACCEGWLDARGGFGTAGGSTMTVLIGGGIVFAVMRRLVFSASSTCSSGGGMTAGDVRLGVACVRGARSVSASGVAGEPFVPIRW